MPIIRISVAEFIHSCHIIFMAIKRRLDLTASIGQRSVLLLGPRQTGKSTLLRSQFPDSHYINLLHTDVFFRFQTNPSRLRHEINALPPGNIPIIIDEIQKLPVLLDEVQALIDTSDRRFILTGSSARKLKSGGANLLGGRARLRHLFPFTTGEIVDSSGDYDLSTILQRGLLPPVWFSDSPEEDLAAYCGTYLKEEIQAEALVRKLDGFSRFLAVAGMSNGLELNYEALSRDCAVPARTVREYVAILTDTLVASTLEPWRHGNKRKPVSSAKLYFFDLGVARTLAQRMPPNPGSTEWGLALEQLLFQELKAWLAYRPVQQSLAYWRTVDQREVDFLVGDILAIEVKASTRITDRDLRGLRALQEEHTFKWRLLVCQEPVPRLTDDGILLLPVKDFLTRLWAGEWD